MAVKDNIVYSTALQFSKNFKATSPEAVLYGYSKLLLMDEITLKNLIPEQNMHELDDARTFMENSKLDLKLIKSGLLLLVSFLEANGTADKNNSEFEKELEESSAEMKSVDILKKALAMAAIPMDKTFTIGKTMEDVFAYQEELKKKIQKSDMDSENPVQVEMEKPEPEPKTEQAAEEQHDFVKLSEKYRNLSSALLDTVKGQDQAVFKFVQGCFRGELLKEKNDKKKPRSYFFFFGPPGTGKTLFAKTAAENMGVAHKYFNLSEYASEYSNQELTGTMAKFVRENPECVLIIDEIEKASAPLFQQFSQILRSGRLQNSMMGVDVSFSDATIIFITNAGKALYADRSINFSSLPENVILNAMQKVKEPFEKPLLPSEICSQISGENMVLFNHLNVRHLSGMVNQNFEKISRDMEEVYGCHITYSPNLPLLFIHSRGGGMDGWIASNRSGNFLKTEIYELTRQIENLKSNTEKIRSIHFDIEWDELGPELKRLFVNESKAEILVLADAQTTKCFQIDEEKYVVHYADSGEKAIEFLKRDIVAVFIDPFFGAHENNDNLLSISDYNTEGMKLFRDLADKEMGLPIYLLEVDKNFSNVDRRTFLQEGASGIVTLNTNRISGFVRQFEQLMEELYMEYANQTFSQQGWVIDYDTKQDNSAQNGTIKILFYNFKKRKVIDAESGKALLSDVERPNVKFDDVIGAEKAKGELLYFIDYLKNPRQFLASGGKPPKGVLLYGPPGTGKTMLARAMAGESDVSFIQTSATEFMDKYLGESEANVRKVFAQARQNAPAIIFIDEIDAIGKKRTGGSLAHATESMLNALLTEMDGFSSNNKKPVFVLAATNYGVGAESDGIAALDEALVRRFDNKIYVDLPNQEERKTYMLRMLEMKAIQTVSEQVVENVAERTTGQSLAIIQNILDLAFRNATKEHRKVEDNDLLNALEEYIYGEKKESTLEYYKSVAIHETGHAYISYLAGDAPSYITIESRGNFGGYMQHGNTEDIRGYTKEDLLGKIRTSLAGRAAEQVFFGEKQALNTGASSDLKAATHYAFLMICNYGMADNQLVVLDRDVILKSTLAETYIKQVNELLDEQMKETLRLVEEGKHVIEKIADELVKRNHLTGQEFKMLMDEM